MWLCPRCAVANEDEARPCVGCGETLLPEQGPGGGPSNLHFLVPPVGEPLELDVSRIVVLGRDPSCGIRIASDSVSRRHAELRWRRDTAELVLRDLNSQNGTYVDNVRMHDECVIRDGTKLRLGDYIATYRTLPRGAPSAALAATMSDTVVDDDSAPRSKAISGDAALFPLIDVVGRLAAHRATGRLELNVDGIPGHLWIAGGVPRESAYAGLEGEVALRAILALAKGRFSFRPEGEAPQPQSWASVLMPAAEAAPDASVSPSAMGVLRALEQTSKIKAPTRPAAPAAAPSAAPAAPAAHPAPPPPPAGPAAPRPTRTMPLPAPTDKRPTVRMLRPPTTKIGHPKDASGPGSQPKK